MRIAVACFAQETNTFAPQQTRYEDFENNGIGGFWRGEEMFRAAGLGLDMGGILDEVNALGWTPVPLLMTYAEPSGALTRETFETITEELAERLQQAMPVDGVALQLHGAMVADSYPDAEAALVKRLRAVVGEDLPIVVSLDLHGNLSDAFFAEVHAATAYRTYPHVDMKASGHRVVRILSRLLAEKRRPKVARWRAPFLMPVNRQYTFSEPCSLFYELVARLEDETPTVDTASLMMGFPYADVEDAGPCVFAYGASKDAVDTLVGKVGDLIESYEGAFTPQLHTIAEASDAAAAWRGEGALILADVQDNAGGGSPSDSMEIARALLERGVCDVIVGAVNDGDACAAAHEAGVGAVISLSLGGKGMPDFVPLSGAYRIVAINTEPVVLTGPMMNGGALDLGPTALLERDGVKFVVTTKRSQCTDQAYFTHLGCDPAEARVIVIKSTMHYRSAFLSVAGDILDVEAPGAVIIDTRNLPYRNLRSGVRLFGGGPPFSRS